MSLYPMKHESCPTCRCTESLQLDKGMKFEPAVSSDLIERIKVALEEMAVMLRDADHPNSDIVEILNQLNHIGGNGDE